jgi:hypothetical protein
VRTDALTVALEWLVFFVVAAWCFVALVLV